MARIIYPEPFLLWKELFGKVKPKCLALATPNPIDDFLTEENINLVTDETNLAKAVLANKVFDENEKLSEKLMEQNHKLFKKPWNEHLMCVQFLKKLFRTSPHKLGDWGVTVDGTNRITYPANFLERKKCVLDLIARHNTFAPGASPLQAFLDENNIDLAQNQTDTNAAATALVDWDTAHALKEQKREERELLLAPIKNHLRGIGAIAVAWYATAPKKANSLGFEIDDSPQAPKLRKITLGPGEEAHYNNLNVGGLVSVLSEGTLGIKPLTKPEAPFTEINSQKSYKLERGNGKSIFKNFDPSKKLTFIAEFHA